MRDVRESVTQSEQASFVFNLLLLEFIVFLISF